MSTFKFVPPIRYDLEQIILGESASNTGILTPVASSTAIGSFPEYISEYIYADSTDSYYYGLKWKYENGTYSSWSSPRMRGKTGIESNYIIVNAPEVSSVYIMNPVSGDVATYDSTWLGNNLEYYVTIKASLSGSLTYPMGEEYEFTFTSRYCPLFTSVDSVRYEAGGFINNLTDDTVNRIIYKNSTYIMNRYLAVMGNSVSGSYTCDGSLLNNAFKRYVVCKSALDSITAIQLSLGGNTSKKLADFQINYSSIDQNKDPFNKKYELKQCIDTSMEILFSRRNFQVGVRGKYHDRMPHPMNDKTYGRLSTINKSYPHEMRSKFNQVEKGTI